MYNRKHIKPDLLDTMMEKRIIKTLKPRTEDYWGPTKNGAVVVWENYIRPNIWFIIAIIAVVIFLIYRYRSIKAQREAKQAAAAYRYYYGPYGGPHIPHSGQYEGWETVDPLLEKPKSNIDKYADMLLELYNFQKENSREPKTTDWMPNQRAHRSFDGYPNTQSKSRYNPRSQLLKNRRGNAHQRLPNQGLAYQRLPNQGLAYQRLPNQGLAYPMYPYEGGILTPSGY